MSWALASTTCRCSGHRSQCGRRLQPDHQRRGFRGLQQLFNATPSTVLPASLPVHDRTAQYAAPTACPVQVRLAPVVRVVFLLRPTSW